MNTPNPQTVHALFERTVELASRQIAVRHGPAELTYRELDRRANALAQELEGIGVGRGQVVALAMARSIDMIVAMVAILKAGAAYLPLDANNPVRRNTLYLDEARVGCILTDHDCGELGGGTRKVVKIGAGARLNGSDTESTTATVGPDDRAYVMFTSGSSGRPKGVVVPHRAIVRLVKDTNYITIGSADRILQFSPPSFDASTFEIWGALLNGAGLVLYSGSVLDPKVLKADIREQRITILWLTAALFHLIADRYIEALKTIKVLLAGGDVLNPKFVNKVLDRVPGITVINGYGPTENTTFTCCHRITANNRPGQVVPIGTEIRGTRVHILDESLRPVPPGKVGELYASGAGVALGYLNGDEHLGAFFVDQQISDGLIYRTGDLVRRNSRGEIEFVGRKDNQVKVRGYRVSLEEIESHLIELEHVNDAVVMVQNESGGDQLLIAYLQVEEGSALSAGRVRTEMSLALPRYMVPDKIVLDTELPITANGKIDRNRIQSQMNSFA